MGVEAAFYYHEEARRRNLKRKVKRACECHVAAASNGIDRNSRLFSVKLAVRPADLIHAGP
jgi:hypothetical protein